MRGCVLDLKMRDKQGTTVTDYSRYGNDGAVNGGAVWTKQGMRFDGSSGYLDCGSDASLNLQKSDFTISNWILSDVSKAALQMVSTKYDGGHVGWFLCIRDFGVINAKYGSGVAREIYSPTACISVGNWYHVVFTHNATKDIIYVDGVNIKEQASFNENVNATAPLLVGLYSTLWFDGSIDDVRIYNYALPLREIKAYYGSTRHNYE